MEFNPSEVILLLLATIGPLKVTIVCASLTSQASPERLKAVALRSVLTATIICVLFVLLGEAILGLFKISVPAFQIGGGIIVLVFSLDMVSGSKKGNDEKASVSEESSSPSTPDIAIYPLAIPLMASVSGLVSIVSFISQRNDLPSLTFLTGAILSIMAINYLCLRCCQLIVKYAGTAVLDVVGRLMGVILTALAIELMLMGLIGLGILSKPA